MAAARQQFQFRMGGVGGFGQGPRFAQEPVNIDDSAKNQVDDFAADDFCDAYHLGDDIRYLLVEQGFDPINALFDTKEEQLEEAGFKVGQIAELRWALRKMLSERYPSLRFTSTEAESTTSIHGGRGGAGGEGLQRGGQGGTGKAPRIRTLDLFRFNAIGGGIGGAGGAGGMRGFTGTSQTFVATKGAPMTRGNRPDLAGGIGGEGGWSDFLGGTGGLGGAPQLPVLRVALFRKISGGTGGAGGRSEIEGGRGGDGEGPAFANLLLPIDEATRGRVPYTTLENFSIKPELRQFLKDGGFQTVGGLFEAYDKDLESLPHFKPGHVRVLTGALRKFAAKYDAELSVVSQSSSGFWFSL